jgi:hypothetical protein
MLDQIVFHRGLQFAHSWFDRINDDMPSNAWEFLVLLNVEPVEI